MRPGHLELARRHVAKDEKIVADQERRVHLKRQRGEDCVLSEALLVTFQTTLGLFEDDLRAYLNMKAT